MNKERRRLLKTLGILTVGTILGCRYKGRQHTHKTLSTSKKVKAVIAYGDPYKATKKALKVLSNNLKDLISRGDKVVIKPNIGWAREPKYAATTSPIVVKAIAELALEAGAAKVIITDNPTSAYVPAFELSGFSSLIKELVLPLVYPEPNRFSKMNLKGEFIKEWLVFKELVETDVLINVPVAKQHNSSILTLGMKNFYGGLGGYRGQLHQKIHQSIVDVARFFKPHLTVIDASRIMIKNGPTGGSLNDVLVKNTIIASYDPVLADALAAKRLFNMLPTDIPFIKLANKQGLGQLEETNILELIA